MRGIAQTRALMRLEDRAKAAELAAEILARADPGKPVDRVLLLREVIVELTGYLVGRVTQGDRRAKELLMKMREGLS